MESLSPGRPEKNGPAVDESPLTRWARRFFRCYRNGPVRLGHPLLRRVLRALMRRHQRVVLRNGLKMEIDLDLVVQHTIFWYDGDMEPQLSWAVREFLPVGGTMIDCGANCGYVGLEARLHKHARVLFLEPHPALAAAIRRNIALNGWEDFCQLIPAAASDTPGKAELFVCRDYDGAHSLLADWSNSSKAETLSVEKVTLQQALENEPGFETVDFAKIDTEGHDFNVLRGLGDRLTPRTVRMLYVELGRKREEACQLMQQRGYAGFVYRKEFSGVQLREAVRRLGDGQPIALFRPLSQCASGGETLWCGQGSPFEQHLTELAERSLY